MCSVATIFVINVKYVYSAPWHMVIAVTLYVAHICVYIFHKSVKYWAYMAFMPNLVVIFVSSTYLAITWEVYIAVGCVREYVQIFWVLMAIKYVSIPWVYGCYCVLQCFMDAVVNSNHIVMANSVPIALCWQMLCLGFVADVIASLCCCVV